MGTLRETRRTLGEQYPGTEFQILFWDYPEDPTPRLLAAMKVDDFVVHRVSEILDGFSENPEPYLLPHQMHPNARAHDLIAHDLFDHVVGSGAEDEKSETAPDRNGRSRKH